MSDDHCRIQVGDNEVGIMGLKQAITHVARSHADESDEEVQKVLLEILSTGNYIANSSKQAYGKAFVREFRKFLGQPFEEADQDALRVVVLGPGCYQCNRLEQTVIQALNELALPASFEHVTDIKEMAAYGFVPTPALLINGKVIAKGTLPSVKKIKEWLIEANQSSTVRNGKS